MEYKDISINQYQNILTIIENYKITKTDNFEFEIYDVISDLIKKFHPEIIDPLNLSVSEFNKYSKEFEFLNKEIKPNKLKNVIELKGVKYNFVLDYTKWKAGQFIDFSNLTKQVSNEVDYIYLLPSLLSCFLMPKIEGQGLSGEELAEVIATDLDIETGCSLVFFCGILWESYAKNIMSYLEKTQRKIQKRQEKQLLKKNSKKV